MRGVVWGGFALTLVVAALAVSGVAAGGGNEPPLADAGLDQRVTAGETVRLDATGSRDPDGSVAGYEWSIETPGGGTVAPECPTCGTTSFRPDTPGRYDVTISVTDDDGARRTDTLYVEVDRAPGPTVSLSGPTEPTVASGAGGPSGQATYVANFSRGGNPIDYVEWLVDGEQTVQRPIDDSGVTTVNYVHDIDSAANQTVGVRVVDVAGRNATDSLSVSPVVESTSGSYDDGDSGSDPYMQAEWGDRTITFLAPTIDTSTGEVVRQSNPTNRQLTNVVTADPGEEVQTDFTGRDDRNSNRDINNADTTDSYNQNSNNENSNSNSFLTSFGGGGIDDNNSAEEMMDNICVLC